MGLLSCKGRKWVLVWRCMWVNGSHVYNHILWWWLKLLISCFYCPFSFNSCTHNNNTERHWRMPSLDLDTGLPNFFYWNCFHSTVTCAVTGWVLAQPPLGHPNPHTSGIIPPRNPTLHSNSWSITNYLLTLKWAKPAKNDTLPFNFLVLRAWETGRIPKGP